MLRPWLCLLLLLCFWPGCCCNAINLFCCHCCVVLRLWHQLTICCAKSEHMTCVSMKRRCPRCPPGQRATDATESTGQDQHHRHSLLLYSPAQYAPEYSANVSLLDVSVGVIFVSDDSSPGKESLGQLPVHVCTRPPVDAEATIIFLWDNGSNGANHLTCWFEINDGMHMG